MKGILKGIDLKKLAQPALFGLAAFVGSIIAIQKLPILEDKREIKKLLFPVVLCFLLLKVAKKKEAQIGVVAGVLPVLAKAIADMTKSKQITSLIPLELGQVYELPITDPRAQALLQVVQPQQQTVHGEILPNTLVPKIQVEIEDEDKYDSRNQFFLNGSEDFILSGEYEAGLAAEY